MDSNNTSVKDHISNLIDDNEFQQVKQYKEETEKAAVAIYIFAALLALSFAFYFLKNPETRDWINISINILVVIFYFCLGAYSYQKPFTAFVATLCTILVVFLLNFFLNGEVNTSGLLLKGGLIVFLCLQLNAARKVEAYQKKAKRFL